MNTCECGALLDTLGRCLDDTCENFAKVVGPGNRFETPPLPKPVADLVLDE